MQSRLNLLGAELKQTNKLAKDEELPEATIKATTGLKVTPLDAVLPESVQNLITKVSRMLPSIKITELLLEVDEWTGFSNQFTHLKTDETAKDKYLLLATILSDGINLDIAKWQNPALVSPNLNLLGYKRGISVTKPMRQHSVCLRMPN